MKCPEPICIGRARRKCDVHRSTLGSPSADLIGKARAGKQISRCLVQADGHDPRLVVKDRLYAVTVVNVDVDITNPLTTVVQQPANSDGYVVVDAEAAGIAGHGVMQPAADVGSPLRVTGPDPAGGLDACHRHPGRDLVHSWKHWIVAGSEPIALVGLASLHGGDVVRGMDGLQ